MAALGPYLKKKFIADGIDPKKLVDLGVARTDDIVEHAGEVYIDDKLKEEPGIDPAKKIVAYMPTFWGASSIYNTGLEIVKNMPDEYTLIFRPHPQTPAKLLRKYLRIIRTKDNVIYAPEGKFKNLGLVDIFNASSVIIGDVSSVMLEAILTKKPLVFAYDTGEYKQSENDYVSIVDIVKKSGKVYSETAHQLPMILQKAFSDAVDESLWNQTIKQNFYCADGTSVSAIKKFITSLL